tara:strand:+ start:14970 stop:15509 length:540 start_codon:yes stop_codon:yes gene_type:complete
MRGVIIGRIDPVKGYQDLVPSDRDGCKEICESGQFPGTQTDSVMVGKNASDPYPPEMSEDMKKMYAAKAKAAGVNTTGMMYCGGLAQEQADVKAYIDPSNYRAEYKKRCHETGMGAKGLINIKTRMDAEPNSERYIADDIVEERAVMSLVNDGADKVSVKELNAAKDKARASLSPKATD